MTDDPTLGRLLLLVFNLTISVGCLLAVFNIRRWKKDIPWRTGLMVMASFGLFAITSVIGTSTLIATNAPPDGIVTILLGSLRALASGPILAFILRYALPLRVTGGLERWLLPIT